MTLRTLNLPLCPDIPIGTLNATTLAILLRAAVSSPVPALRKA